MQSDNRPRLDILFMISNGFSMRMIEQSGLLGLLYQKGLLIGILVPDISDESVKDLRSEDHIEIFEYNIQRSLLQRSISAIRNYVLNDIESNPALLEKFKSRITTKQRSILNSLFDQISWATYIAFRQAPRARRIFKLFEQRVFRSSMVQAQLESIYPKLFVCTYPVLSPEPEFILACKSLNIPSVLHLLSWDNITAKGIFPALPDNFVVWGPVMAQELQNYYHIQPKAIAVVGVPHFDAHIKALAVSPNDSLRQIGLDPDLPYLFFAMSAPRFCPAEIEIVEWLAHSIAEFHFGSKLQLIIRPHPQNVQGDMADLSWLPRLTILENLKGVAVLYPEMNKKTQLLYSINKSDMQDFTILLAHSSIVLHSGSTIGIDAMMSDRPVIMTSFDANQDIEYWRSARRLKDYTHLAQLLAYEGVSVVIDFPSLSKAIFAYLTDPNFKSNARRFTIEEYCLNNDGLATKRAAEYYIDRVNSLSQC